MAVMAVHIGTSGWSYAHWTSVLYPENLPAARRLDHYTRQFQTVELNASYYRWPSDAAFESWQQRLPEGFLLTVKAPGSLTHRKRLHDPDKWLARIGQGLDRLGSKIGVLLAQLPSMVAVDLPRLAYFLERVPPGLRICVEFRNPTWLQDGTFELLEKHGAAYCVMSGAGLPCVLRATAPFVYVRLHGPDHDHLYAGSYSDDDLRWWANCVRDWHGMGRDVFLYFNNDGGGNAVRNALTLKGMLGA
jgi:uncharacterized protein YecE (DUF72 family)